MIFTYFLNVSILIISCFRDKQLFFFKIYLNQLLFLFPGDRPDLNLSEDEPPVCAVVQAQPEATSTPKEIGQFKI